MKFTYDRKSDMGYVRLHPRWAARPQLRTEEVAPGVNVDYVVGTGQLFGIEIFGLVGQAKRGRR